MGRFSDRRGHESEQVEQGFSKGGVAGEAAKRSRAEKARGNGGKKRKPKSFKR